MPKLPIQKTLFYWERRGKNVVKRWPWKKQTVKFGGLACGEIQFVIPYLKYTKSRRMRCENMPFRRFFQSKISRMLFATFVILAIPLIVINFVITSRGIQLMRAQISGAYRNSLALIADQFQDRLKDLEMMAASMTIDDALNAMCIAEKGEENLFEYVQFQSRMRGYVNQRILKGNISVILPKQGWVFPP